MTRLAVNLKPAPCVPRSAAALGLEGEPILAVEKLPDGRVVAVTGRGMAVGAAQDVLPLSLRRAVAGFLTQGVKKFGPKMKLHAPEDYGEDTTYDSDSSAPEHAKPDAKEPGADHPKERAIKRVFQDQTLVVDPEDVTTWDSFPSDLPALHPKEVAIQKAASARQLTPAQHTDVQSLKNKIEAAERNIQSAKSSLGKWLQGPQFDPQKQNLGQDLKGAMQATRAALSFVEKL